MYTVSVTYVFKTACILVHPDMSWLEFAAVCKYAFEIKYAIVCKNGDERRLELAFDNRETHDRIKYEMHSKIGTLLKDIDIELVVLI